MLRENAVQAAGGSKGIALREDRMKVLLDECLPVDPRHHLPGHEVHKAEWAGFKGLKNGQFLEHRIAVVGCMRGMNQI